MWGIHVKYDTVNACRNPWLILLCILVWWFGGAKPWGPLVDDNVGFAVRGAAVGLSICYSQMNWQHLLGSLSCGVSSGMHTPHMARHLQGSAVRQCQHSLLD